MKKPARVAQQCLQLALHKSTVGTTTEDIDKIIHDFIISQNAYPTAINFHGFPKSVCASPNEVVCHGIPDERPLLDGDIISYDCTVYLDGYHGDCAGTALIGNVSEEGRHLSEASLEGLNAAIKMCGPGVPFAEIGRCVQNIATNHGFGVISQMCGHFIGRELHQPPLIPHTYPNDSEGTMCEGQTFTIEPIFVTGETKLRTWRDGWTLVTADNGLAAQWEHTIVITQNGAEILTQI